MYTEFQREKEDLLESVRMLQDQMQLKDMVIEAFIPPEEVQKVGGRVWVGRGRMGSVAMGWAGVGCATPKAGEPIRWTFEPRGVERGPGTGVAGDATAHP